MLTIEVVGSQILISNNGVDYDGLPKNSLTYKPTFDDVEFYLIGNDKHPYIKAKWDDGITINGEEVNKENINTVLSLLFKSSGGTGNTPTLQDVAEAGNTTTIPLKIPAAQADDESVQFGQMKTTLNGYVKGFGVTEIRVVTEIPEEQKEGVLYILTE